MSTSRARRIILPCLLLMICAGCGESVRLEPLPPDAVVLAFGDSLTRGTGADADAAYPAVLARETGLRVINAGVPGEVSSDGLARLPGLLEQHRPRLVILCHGGNDVLRRLDPAQTRANLAAMVEAIRGHGAEVVLLGVPKFGLVASAAPWYPEIAEQYAIAYDGNIIPDLQHSPAHKSDSVHFNAEGYRLLAEAVRELLVRHGALPDDS